MGDEEWGKDAIPHSAFRIPHSPLTTLFCLATPLTILALAYAWLAVDHDTPWLWNVKVHESGRYTLRETVFYFGHFLREVPVDVGMALFLLAGFMNARAISPNKSLDISSAARWAWPLLAAAAGLVAAGFAIAASQQGWASAALDLLQFRTRDYLSEYGSHWRFHWLSTLWFGVATMLASNLRSSTLDPRFSILDPRSSIFHSRSWLAAWGYFAMLTTVFWFSGKTFTDVRYTGHQAREIMTHGPVTCLLGFGVLRLLAAHLSGLRIADRIRNFNLQFRNPQSAIRNPQSLLLALFLLIPLYLAAVTLSGDVLEAGQSERGLAAMVGAHFFEHVLDYLLVILLVAGGYAWVASRQLERQVLS